MNRGKIALKNSSISFAAHILTILLQFVTRSVFIRYLSIELLGLSSTFTSLLNALSLAELGFQQAVVFNLYAPLSTGDQEMVGKIVSVYKRIYWSIGVFFIAAAFCCLPLLPYVAKGVEITNYVRRIFLIHAANSACTYFLAYKRSLLYADQHGYLSNLVDTIVNILASVLQLLLLFCFRSYILYLLVRLLQTVVSNGIVHIMCSKRYPYLHSEKVDTAILKKVFSQAKEIFAGRIAGYIYSSTDSLIISSFVGTIHVGFLSNYTIITNSIRALANSITAPIAPVIGSLLASSEEEKSQIAVFELYNFVRFLLSGLTALPIIVLTDSFVEMWIGAEYRLPASIVMLLAADLYIHIIHSSCCDYIYGKGLFAIDKKISMIGAATNLITSVALVIRLGIPGVLIGTVFSQMVFWITRSYVTYKHCFHASGREYMQYWGKMLFYLAVSCGTCYLQKVIYNALDMNSTLVHFLVGGLVCEALFLCAALLSCCWMPEERTILSFIRRSVPGLLKHLKILRSDP